MLTIIVRLIRIVSILACLIVAVSFLVFAVNQTKSGSAHQQEQLSTGPAGASTTAPAASAPVTAHESGARRSLDDASDTVTSPFASVFSKSSSEWVSRGGKLLLTLVVYGFGLGFLARVLRVRV